MLTTFCLFISRRFPGNVFEAVTGKKVKWWMDEVASAYQSHRGHLLSSCAAGSRSTPSAVANTVFPNGIFPFPAQVEKPGLLGTVLSLWAGRVQRSSLGFHTSAQSSTEEAESVGSWPWKG